VTFQATDIAGNVTSETHTLNIDTQGALLGLSGNADFCPACGDTLLLTYSVQDGGSGIQQWQLLADGVNLASGTAEINSTTSWDGSGLAVGAHTITLQAEDLAGNSGQTTLTVTIQAAPVIITGTPVTGNPGIIASATSARTPTPTPTRTATRTPQTTTGSIAAGIPSNGNGSSSGNSTSANSPITPVLPWAVAAAAAAVTTATTVYTRKRDGEEIIQIKRFGDIIEPPKTIDELERGITGSETFAASLQTNGDLYFQNHNSTNTLDELANRITNGSFISQQNGKDYPIGRSSLLNDSDYRTRMAYAYIDEYDWQLERLEQHVDEVLSPRLMDELRNAPDVSSQRRILNQFQETLDDLYLNALANENSNVIRQGINQLATRNNLQQLEGRINRGSLIANVAAIAGNLSYTLFGWRPGQDIGSAGEMLDAGFDVGEAIRTVGARINNGANRIISTELSQSITTITRAARVAGGLTIIAGAIGIFSGGYEIYLGNSTNNDRLTTMGILDVISGGLSTIAGIAMFIPFAQPFVPFILGASGLVTLASFTVEHWDTITSTVNTIRNTTPIILHEVGNRITNTVSQIGQTITNTANTAGNWIENTVHQTAQTIQTIATNVTNGITTAARGVGTAVQNFLQRTGAAFEQAGISTRSAITQFSQSISSTATRIGNSVTNALSNMGNTVGNAIRNGVSQISNTVTSAFRGVANTISNGISNLFNPTNNSTINNSVSPNMTHQQLSNKTTTKVIKPSINHKSGGTI